MDPIQIANQPTAELIAAIEGRCGGPRQAADFLGVKYNGSWQPYKTGKTRMPDYVRASIEAHLLIKDSHWRELTAARDQIAAEGDTDAADTTTDTDAGASK